MGAEFRIELSPPLGSLDAACDSVFAETQWQRTPTSLVEHADGIGVQHGLAPAGSSWPQVADICCNDDGTFYAVAHNALGVMFLHKLKEHLEFLGHKVVLDNDYY